MKKLPTLEDVGKEPQITVQEGVGYNLQLVGRANASPAEVYEVLTDPDTVGVWRSIDSCTHRKILEENNGKRKIEVSHRAIARFLFLTVHFDTHLLVWEDDNDLSIRFTNSRPSFMKVFDGSWNVQPFTAAALQKSLQRIKVPHHAYNPSDHVDSSSGSSSSSHRQQPFQPPSWLSPSGMASFMQKLAPQSSSQHSATLVTLEQHLVPKAPAPPGIKHLIRGLCAKQLKDMMEDLEAELERRAVRKAKGQAAVTSHGPSGLALAATSTSSAAVTKTSTPASAAPAASMTLAFPALQSCLTQAWKAVDIWESREPLVTITISL